MDGIKTQPEMRDDFVKEIRRFPPAAMVRETVEKDADRACPVQVID